jgi:hypothetical protein
MVAAMPERAQRLGMFWMGMVILKSIPLTRNANSVFRRKGGESPKWKGGSGVKDGRCGGAMSAQARLCERGRWGGAAPTAGGYPCRRGGCTPCICTRGRRGVKASDRTEAKRSPESPGRQDGEVPKEWT